MILISHRGNTDSINLNKENTQDYIDLAIKAGFDVEIDIWFNNNEFYLGHDNPCHPVKLKWLLERKDKLWIHAKNFNALKNLIDIDVKVFFHEKEKHSIINNCNIIWSHELNEADEISIIPLLTLESLKNYNKKPVYGICSDYVAFYKVYNK